MGLQAEVSAAEVLGRTWMWRRVSGFGTCGWFYSFHTVTPCDGKGQGLCTHRIRTGVFALPRRGCVILARPVTSLSLALSSIIRGIIGPTLQSLGLDGKEMKGVEFSVGCRAHRRHPQMLGSSFLSSLPGHRGDGRCPRSSEHLLLLGWSTGG